METFRAIFEINLDIILWIFCLFACFTLSVTSDKEHFFYTYLTKVIPKANIFANDQIRDTHFAKPLAKAAWHLEFKKKMMVKTYNCCMQHLGST